MPETGSTYFRVISNKGQSTLMLEVLFDHISSHEFIFQLIGIVQVQTVSFWTVLEEYGCGGDVIGSKDR